MARTRNIKPGFFKNDMLAECEPLARILYAGLWTYADRDGRGEYRSKMIKAELLPFDDCNVDVLMWQLCSRGFVRVYSVDGRNFFDIPTFGAHQNPHKEEPSKKHPTCTVQALCKYDAGTWSAPCNNGCSTLVTGPSSFSLPPSTLTLPPSTLNDSFVASRRKPKNGFSISASHAEAFEQFWKAYPSRNGRKAGKQATADLFAKLSLDDAQACVVAAENYAASESVYSGYAKDPERFLKKDFWRDWLAEPEPVRAASRVPTQSDLDNWNPIDGGLGNG